MIEISTDKNRLNIDFIHAFLSNSYWGKGRTIEEVKRSIEHSICFGIYLDGQQIGFTRVLTDQTIFAYLMDVFIDEKYRGKGYSKLLLTEILSTPYLKEVKKWALKTGDAHGLYEQFGFHLVNDPENWMDMDKGGL
jgi:GNAT superfamily N-acetyltransferase